MSPTDATSVRPALTQKQQEFVLAFISTRGQNATAAAIAAGYSSKCGGAAVTAHRLLRDPRILDAIGKAIVLPRPPRACPHCGEMFAPKRELTAHCGVSACKQAAYRNRKREAA